VPTALTPARTATATATSPPSSSSSHAIAAALESNVALQARLSAALRNLDALLQSNANLSSKLLAGAVGNAAPPPTPGAAGANEALNGKKRVAGGGYGGPFRTLKEPPFETSRFWRVGAATPTPNADTLRVAPAFRLSPRSFPLAKWSRGDDEALLRAAVDAVRERRFAEALEGAARARARKRGGGGGWNGGDEDDYDGEGAAAAVAAAAVLGTSSSVPPPPPPPPPPPSSSLLDAAASAAASLTADSPGVESEVDAFSLERWDRVAASALPARSGAALAARWREVLRPSVAALEGEGGSVPWSREEDAALKRAVGRHGERDWSSVAREVNAGSASADATDDDAPAPAAAAAAAAAAAPGAAQSRPRGRQRTPFACLSRYRRSLDSATVTCGRWTPADDAALAAAVATHGAGNSWAAVAAALSERAAAAAEVVDGETGEAVNASGITRHWTSKQVYHRWRILSGAGGGAGGGGGAAGAGAHAAGTIAVPRTLGAWTPEEDEALVEAVRAVGEGRWSLAAARVWGRTDVQCRGRYLRALLPRVRRLGEGATAAEVAAGGGGGGGGSSAAVAPATAAAAAPSASAAASAATAAAAVVAGPSGPATPRLARSGGAGAAGPRRARTWGAEAAARRPHSGGPPFTALERKLLLRAHDDELAATRREGRQRLRWEPVLRRFRELLAARQQQQQQQAAAGGGGPGGEGAAREEVGDRSSLMQEDVRVETLKLVSSREAAARLEERKRATRERKEREKREREEARAARKRAREEEGEEEERGGGGREGASEGARTATPQHGRGRPPAVASVPSSASGLVDDDAR